MTGITGKTLIDGFLNFTGKGFFRAFEFDNTIAKIKSEIQASYRQISKGDDK